MAYTTIDNPGEYFNTVLYTGNGSTSHAISNVGFSPNWVWVKERGGANSHMLCDTVRSATNVLFSNLTNAEDTGDAGSITAFGSDGFTVGNSGNVNANNDTYVGWNWKAGTSFTNDASSTGVGSIDSAGSFNNDAGFSIVSYTGTAQNGTIKHGMNITPSMIIFKNRNTTNNWNVFHKTLGNGKFIRLNESDAPGNTGRFNSTSPTSSVFSVGVNGATAVNGNGNSIIAYCFAEVKGYSKFSSYIGNGNANGTFVYTGFKPSFVLMKNTADGGANWQMFDNKRDVDNVANHRLFPSLNNAENSDTNNNIDIVSNGFKMRTSNGDTNANGSTFIYMAFAENPFVTSTGIPATAR